MASSIPIWINDVVECDRQAIAACTGRFTVFEDVAIFTEQDGSVGVQVSLKGEKDVIVMVKHERQFGGEDFKKLYDLARQTEDAQLHAVSHSESRVALMYSLGARVPRYTPKGILKTTALSKEAPVLPVLNELLFGKATMAVDRLACDMLPVRAMQQLGVVDAALVHTYHDGKSLMRPDGTACVSPLFTAWQWTKKDEVDAAAVHPLHFDQDNDDGLTFVHSFAFQDSGSEKFSSHYNAQFDMIVRVAGDNDHLCNDKNSTAKFGQFVKISVLLTTYTPLAFAAKLIAHRALPPPGLGQVPGVITSMAQRRSAIWYTNRLVRPRWLEEDLGVRTLVACPETSLPQHRAAAIAQYDSFRASFDSATRP